MANETLWFISSFNEQFSTFVIAFFTVILALATIALAYFTFMLFTETKKMRELQTDPKLSVYLTSSKIEIIFKNLIIENIGFGPAYNVKFQLNKDFTLQDGRKLSEIHMIKNGLSYIPPNEKYEFLLTDADYIKVADEYLTIKTTYQNSMKKLFSDEFILDFSLWKNMETLNVKGFNHVVKELQKINETLEKIKK